MKTYEYITINQDSATNFQKIAQQKGAKGYRLTHFEYREYPQKVEGKVEIFQAYVGIMEKEKEDVSPERAEPDAEE